MQQALATREADDPWTAAMRRGDFAAAWRVSDDVLRRRVAAREQSWRRPRHEQFVWRGEPLAGRRVLVRCYHGLGDTLQFIRFAEPLREIAGEVVVWAQPQLIPLLRSARGIDELLPLTDGVPQTEYDVDIEVMELAHALRASAHDLGRSPYLRAPDLSGAALPLGRPNVGLVWQAGDWDQRRSVPLSQVRALLEENDVNVVSLQRGAANAQAAELGIADLSSDDVTATASLIARLDLTITVDTMVAHLAGALGAPVWTLLQADCDWRWMGGRDDSPWYPTMRLFRQPAPGDWGAVIAAVRRALASRFA